MGMTNTLEFRRYGRRRWVFCTWEDGEIKLFGNMAVAEAWATAQGFKAIFVEAE